MPKERTECQHVVLGVSGRYRGIHRWPTSGLMSTQTWISETRTTEPGYGMNIEIRFDDECRNGHHTFAVTYEEKEKRTGRLESCGCSPEKVREIFPELEPLLKWHLCSSDGPMHYLANTVYLAGNRDCHGRLKGEPSSYSHGVRFGNSPVTHRIRERFWQWLKSRDGFQLETHSIEHPPTTGYQYSPHWTVSNQGEGGTFRYCQKWHECPFSDETAAREFVQAFNACPVEFVRVPVSWSDGKERELDSARAAAIWPDATDEQLSAEPDELKRMLSDRLPRLIQEFRSLIESIGFEWD